MSSSSAVRLTDYVATSFPACRRMCTAQTESREDPVFWQRQLECLAVLYDAFGRCMLYARTAALGTAVRGLGEDNGVLCPNTLIVATINLTYVNSGTVCPHFAKKINLNFYLSFLFLRAGKINHHMLASGMHGEQLRTELQYFKKPRVCNDVFKICFGLCDIGNIFLACSIKPG